MPEENILKADGSRKYTVFPIKFKKLWDYYKQHEATFWTVEEIRLTDDIVDWNERLNDNEKYFIKNVLAFFASSDGIVNENLLVNFYNEVEIPEARCFYTTQMMMESIHCVSPDTLILTDTGYYPIKLYRNKMAKIWNGYEFSNVLVIRTGRNAELYRVELDNGMYLDCTEKHRWHLQDSFRAHFIKKTHELEPGDEIIDNWTYPIIDWVEEPGIYNFGMISRDEVPINGDWFIRNRWVENFIGNSTCIVSESVDYLRKVQLLLTTLGIKSKITDNNLYIIKQENNDFLNFSVRVKRISKLSGTSDTYCFNEPKKHTGIFGGILTGQSEQYSVLIDTYISDSDERNKLFSAMETIPCVKKKADWAIKWINEGSGLQQHIPDKYFHNYRNLMDLLRKTGTGSLDDLEALNFLVKSRPSFAQRLLAFICVEGIFFSGSFCAIYWLKSRGLMPGLSTANQFISRDENLHAEFAIELYNMLENKLQESIVHSIFQEAVDIEEEFITESLPVSLIGMNCDLMKEYIRYVADRWLVLLGYSKIFNSKNPFNFMEMISVNTKENFFELNVSQYNKANVGTNSEDRELSFDCDDF